MGDRRDLRRRWIAAALVSLAAHGLVFLGLSLTPKDGPPQPPPPVLITLERPERPPPLNTASAPARVSSDQPQLHQPPAAPAAVPNSGLNAASPSIPTAPRTPAPSAPPQQATATAPLKLDCLNLGPGARTGAFGREDCQPRRFPKLARGEGTYDIADNPEWEAQIARQQATHRPLPPEKPFRNDCANSNLGLGCTDGMLIPLVKRKF